MGKRRRHGLPAVKNEKTIKRIGIATVLITTVVTQVLVLVLSNWVEFFPGEEAMKSLTSTIAQIVAGLYGITLAGYTFFLSRIDSLMATNPTLECVVGNIKKRFQYLIWNISFSVLMTLFTSGSLLYFPAPSQREHYFLYRLFCNEFVIFFCFTIGMILLYSVMVTDPSCLEKEARRMKRKLSPENGEWGSAAEFLALYDAIAQTCRAMLPQRVLYLAGDGSRFDRVMELLEELHPERRAVFPELTRVNRYYECMVNCTSMTVTREMCQAAKDVLAQLRQPISVAQTPERP